MIWQDVLIAIVNLTLSYALLPQIYHTHKTKTTTVTIQTSTISAISLLVLTIALFSLGLILSSIGAGISSILWTTILIQKLKYG